MSRLHKFCEHGRGPVEGLVLPPGEKIERFFGRGKEPLLCFEVASELGKAGIRLSCFVGVDWIKRHEHALYVEPKLNGKDMPETDYLGMLFSALKHPDLIGHTGDLFEVQFDDPPIEIEQTRDLLTPLLVVQFLQVLHAIVRKGLKRSYYPVEKHYSATVKGKILVAKTLKHSLAKHRQIDTFCRHEEFGLNGLENRLLKKALKFVQRYLQCVSNLNAPKMLADVFSYILPTFENIAEEVTEEEVKRTPVNVFYREYSEGIRLARLILKRFGYNINNTQSQVSIKTPPFWIDMSKLFELFVLGLLKDRYQNAVRYQEKVHYGNPDFLLNAGKDRAIIDAKYKLAYSYRYDPDDIRQLSGYGRDRGVLKKLGYREDAWSSTVVECLIIYPCLPGSGDEIGGFTTGIDLRGKVEVSEFEQFFKLPVRLPILCEAQPAAR